MSSKYSEQVTIDYLSFTIHYDDSLRCEQDVLAHLKAVMGDFTMLPRGGLGYTQCALVGSDGRVYFGGRPEMGVHVSLPSDALALFRNINQLHDLLNVTTYSVTRLDLAVDTRLDYDKIRKIVMGESEDEVIVTRLKNVREITSYRKDSQNKALVGRTLYLGSPTSQVMMRIYDKALEQNKVNETWTRIELQLRDERADTAFRAFLAEQTDQTLAGILRSAIDVRMRTRDQNRSRWPAAAWWAEILRHAQRVSLPVASGQQTLEACIEWLQKQVSPTLAFVFIAMGGDMAYIRGLLRAGEARLRPGRIHMLEQIGPPVGPARLSSY